MARFCLDGCRSEQTPGQIVPEKDNLKVRYDPETDTLTMRLSEHPVMESDEASPADY